MPKRGEYEKLDGREDDYLVAPSGDRKAPASKNTCLWASIALFIVALFAGVGLVIYFTSEQVVNEPVHMWETLHVDDVKRHLMALQDIASNTTDKNRAAGTEGYNRSLIYVREQLEATNFYDIYEQPFAPVVFQSGKSTLKLTAPIETPISTSYFSVVRWSEVKGFEGKVHYATENGCKADNYKNMTDAIVLVKYDSKQCDVKAAVDVAHTAGVSAVMLLVSGGSTRLSYGPSSPAETPPASPLPLVALSSSLADTFKGDVSVKADIQATLLTLHTANLIAESKTGSEDTVVVIGSHLDSVPAGPGINDNGSGSSSNLAVALASAKLNLTYSVKVRHCWWAAEEYGLLGSTHYVQSLNKSELDKVALNLNFDMLGSPNFNRYVNLINQNSTSVPKGTIEASVKIEQLFIDFFETQLAVPWVGTPIDNPGRSDYASFLAGGVPVGGLATGAEELKTEHQQQLFGGFAHVSCDFCYHMACDTIDNVNELVLLQNAQALAYTVEHVGSHANVTTWLYGNTTVDREPVVDSPTLDMDYFLW